MTYDEALVWYDDFRDNIVKSGKVDEKYSLALRAMRTAMLALAKQIPQKRKGFACPTCGRLILLLHGQTKGGNFCDICGQAIDWED